MSFFGSSRVLRRTLVDVEAASSVAPSGNGSLSLCKLKALPSEGFFSDEGTSDRMVCRRISISLAKIGSV